MLPYRDSRITKIALAIFFLVVIGYAYYEARGLLYGPSILVPATITEVHDPFITIRGKAERISSLRMNGKIISVTEDGSFEEPYLLAKGYNRIVLDARDKYGRSRQEAVEIVYTPDPVRSPIVPPAPPTATTTATSTREVAPE